MRALAFLSFALPGLAEAAAPHSGQIVRNGFALSDVALFVFAAIGVWLAQRSMRRRAGKRAKD
ncbi:hypothetical protein LZK98_07690 [Sphingomonas cannabina]|uniref:hypothetical protein n=1 Tax=Sphingomonas cannabina TaxID=2899123 RepID=UPI001F4112E2|nr:hypothetical protein [Sphingomonas cannabina]UIJ46815.1 hypothetical protein LZK98_07690 [Sphingomonas cannabina]